jgi:transposase
VFCLDEAHFVVQPYITRGIFLKGSRPTIPTIFSRERISMIGALSENEISSQLIEGNCNWESYLNFLKFLLSKYGKIILVIDGAKYHFEKEHVQKFYKQNEHRLKIMQLPSYSPELNPIEQSWKKVKKWLAIKPWSNFQEFESILIQTMNNNNFRTKMYHYYMR